MTCKKGLIGHQRTRIYILTQIAGGIGKMWEKISEVTDVKPPNASYAEDDATTLEDTDKTVVPAGPRSHSNVDLTLLALSGDEMQKRLYMSNYNGTCESFKIVRPDALATTTEFSGYVKDFGEETDPAKKTRLKLVLTVSGTVGKYDKNGYITPNFTTAGNTLKPIISSIDVAPMVMTAGTTSTVTVTFNQPVKGFEISDMTAPNGVLSDLQTTDNIVFTATLTPDSNVAAAVGRIEIAAGSYINDDEREGGAGQSAAYTVDTKPQPLVSSFDVTPLALGIGTTSTVTVTFNQPVVGFDASDMVAEHATISNLQTTDNIVFTATLTPDSNVAPTTGRIDIAAASYKDAAGRDGQSAQSPVYNVDTLLPLTTTTFALTPDTYSTAVLTGVLNVTFNRAATGVVLADFTAPNGVLSNLQTTDDISYTADFTADAGVTSATAEVTYTDGSVTLTSATYTVDTV